ncbi:MAG: hypothetical protein ACFFER_06135 [Candidatus Thorarchaeota archaeon]
MNRLAAINRFYSSLSELENWLGEKRLLSQCDGRMKWPRRGVYFFFEKGETRENSNNERVVRVGTHAVSKGSGTTLWNRLRTHRGTISGPHKDGGNHRGSIFRLHVGTAILNRKRLRDDYPTWGRGSSASRKIRNKEYPIEKRVSHHIRSMPFLWLEVDDEPSKHSMRAYLERNAIALLSNYQKLGTINAIDPPVKELVGPPLCE